MEWKIVPMDKSHLPEIIDLEKRAFPNSLGTVSMLYSEGNQAAFANYFVAVKEISLSKQEEDLDKYLKDIINKEKKDISSFSETEISRSKCIEGFLQDLKNKFNINKQSEVDSLVKNILASEGKQENINKVVGYAGMWLKLRQAHITTVAVQENFRRKGIGLSLVLKLLREARKARAGHVILEVKHSNSAARNMYEKLGFRTLGVRKNYYIEDREDGIVLFLENLKGKKVKNIIEKFEKDLGII